MNPKVHVVLEGCGTFGEWVLVGGSRLLGLEIL